MIFFGGQWAHRRRLLWFTTVLDRSGFVLSQSVISEKIAPAGRHLPAIHDAPKGGSDRRNRWGRTPDSGRLFAAVGIGDFRRHLYRLRRSGDLVWRLRLIVTDYESPRMHIRFFCRFISVASP